MKHDYYEMDVVEVSSEPSHLWSQLEEMSPQSGDVVRAMWQTIWDEVGPQAGVPELLDEYSQALESFVRDLVRVAYARGYSVGHNEVAGPARPMPEREWTPSEERLP